MKKKCRAYSCDRQAIYGYRGDREKEFCFYHRSYQMVDKTINICHYEDCDKTLSGNRLFCLYHICKNIDGICICCKNVCSNDSKYCNYHKKPEISYFYDSMDKIIEFFLENSELLDGIEDEKCGAIPSDVSDNVTSSDVSDNVVFDNSVFDTNFFENNNHYDKTNTTQYNEKYAKIMCRGKYDEHCANKAIYNYPHENEPLFCSKCKNKGMVNLFQRKCIDEECKKCASFNFRHEKKAIYCNDHKIHGMVNLKNKKCAYPNCTKQPNFNYKTETSGIYCFDHKIDEMIDVKHKKCSHEGCERISNYNFPNKKTKIFCKVHKVKGMVSYSSKNKRKSSFSDEDDYFSIDVDQYDFF